MIRRDVYFSRNTVRGFTLIEAIIFIVIASMAFFLLSSLYLSIIQKSASSEYNSIATSLCEEKMEEVIGLGFNQISVPIDPNMGDGYFLSPFNNYRYFIISSYVNPMTNPNLPLNDPNSLSKKVEIKVNRTGMSPVWMAILITVYPKF